MTGAERIAAERDRQRKREGWTMAHDASHTDESLARAAAVYAMPERFRKTRKRGLWAWASKWYKPTDDRIRELEKAGALIAAEIDRLLAAAPDPVLGTRDDRSEFGRIAASSCRQLLP